MRDYSKYDFYGLLGLERDCDFSLMKKAYYRKAKSCHPDLHGGSPGKEEEFKLVVLAFDVLSDPDKRAFYDSRRFAQPAERRLEGFDLSEFSVMDSDADDTLEELIVGNEIPEHSTLATLFMDLEKTEVFMAFREGKCLYRRKDYRAALDRFKDVVFTAPGNILYRYHLARTYASLGSFSLAAREYSEGIGLGEKRIPPQKLVKFHRELDFVRRKSNPLLQGIISLLRPRKEDNPFVDSEGRMVDEMNRAIGNISAEIEERRKQREKEKRMLE